MATLKHKLFQVLLSFLMAVLPIVADGQTAAQRERLLELSEQYARRFAEEKAEALRLADSLGWPVRQEFEDGRVIELMRIREDGMPMYYTTYNAGGATLIKSDKVYPGGSAGLNLTGAGQTLGIWDGGAVRLTHQEFQTNSTSRVTQKDGATSLSNHATHVAGTMVAGGVISSAQGMSYEAYLDAYDWNDDEADMALAAANGLQVSQHSYGYITGWAYGKWNGFTGWLWFGDVSISETEDYIWGFYSEQAQDWDNIAHNAPNYLIVKSAGNDRGRGPSPGTGHYYQIGSYWYWSTATRDLDGGVDGYQTIAHAGVSKNIIAVGAVINAENMASFSGWGPTDDGRVKPDIVAKGVAVLSPIAIDDDGLPSNIEYSSFSGTSMSGPMVSGSVGLLLEHQENLHPEETLLASTIKALILHSADSEISGAPGPDYRFGWGLMDTEAAVDIMTKNAAMGGNFHIREMTLSDQETIELTVYASGEEDLVATIVWTDPPGTPPDPALNPPDLMLVNDLDMRLTSNATKTEYKPYILDPENPSLAATTGDNFRDNVEQILVSEPANGEAFTLTITHKDDLDGDSQDFSLIITGIAPATYSGNNTNWHDPGNWQYGSPEETEHIKIPAGLTYFPIIPDEVTINNLSIEAGASLSLAAPASVTMKGTLVIQGSAAGKEAEGELIIEAGGSLTVDGTLTITNGSHALILKSDATGSASLIHTTPSVPAQVQYHLKGTPGAWQQISPPVEAQGIADKAGAFGEDGIFFAWHEPMQSWVSSQNQTYYPTWADANQGATALVPMQGYMAAWYHGDKELHPGMGYHHNEKRQTSSDKENTIKSFSGLLNNGNQSFPINRLAHPEDGFAGFNLIGNPYPSYIDWKNDDGWEGRELLESNGDGYSYWVWDATSENFGTYNSASKQDEGTLGASRYIPPAQGMWVKAAAETVTGTLTINNNARTHERPPEEDEGEKHRDEHKHFAGPQQLISGRNAPQAGGIQYLGISVINTKNNFRDEVMLEFGHVHNSGTAKVFSMNASAPGLYLLNGDKKQSIGLLTAVLEHPMIPLGFHAGTSGDFILLSRGTRTIDADVMLHDRFTGSQHKLSIHPQYAFRASPGDMPDRFEIWLQSQDGPVQVINTEEQLHEPHIYSHGNTLFIEKLNRNSTYRLETFDMNGSSVLSIEIKGVSSYFRAVDLPTGPYIVRLTGNQHVVNKKVVFL